MDTFQNKLSALVSKELCKDADAQAGMIEGLTDALGLAIAVSCKGDLKASDTMISGVDGYLAERVADHAKLAALIAEARKTSRGKS